MTGSRFPHPLALIFGMIVLAQVLTYFLPAGTYDHDTERRVLQEARTLPLPPGPKVLLPDDLAILLPDGSEAVLPGGITVQLGAGAERETITLPPRRVLPGGLAPGAAPAAPRALELPDAGSFRLPEGGTIGLPAAEGAETAGGRARVFRGETLRLPAGAWREVPSRNVKEGTYHRVAAEPLPWHAALTKIPKGLEAGAEIIFFVFIVGGVIAVVRATGAIDAAIGAAIRNLGQNPLLLVGGMMTLFAVGSSTIGMAEEYMPFVPILVAMCLALGMDAMVALGVIYIGAGVGYGCAAINPFTVVIAKDIAGLEIEQGMGLRWVLLAITIVIGTHHVLRYASRIKTDPSRSLVADIDYSRGFSMPTDVSFTPARVLVLATFVAAIGVFVWGASVYEWYVIELGAIFLGVALATAVIAGLAPNTVAERFCTGAAELTTTALLIGFARTIQVVFDDAQVTHTIVHDIASVLDRLGPHVAAVGMLAVQSVCNLLIPSGSGQAYVTMPIMAPLADVTEVGRETAVFAYQFGDGFTNMIVPTNALLMGMLALGSVPYQRWLRFILPLLLKVYAVAVIALVLAVEWFPGR